MSAVEELTHRINALTLELREVHERLKQLETVLMPNKWILNPEYDKATHCFLQPDYTPINVEPK